MSLLLSQPVFWTYNSSCDHSPTLACWLLKVWRRVVKKPCKIIWRYSFSIINKQSCACFKSLWWISCPSWLWLFLWCFFIFISICFNLFRLNKVEFNYFLISWILIQRWTPINIVSPITDCTIIYSKIIEIWMKYSEI